MSNVLEQMGVTCDRIDVQPDRGDHIIVIEEEQRGNKAALLGILACSAGAMAVAGCSSDSECSGRHFSCNDASLFVKNGADYEHEADVPKTPASTQLSSSIEKTGESAFDTGVDVAKGSSLLIAPWIIIALISKGAEKGELSEKFYESLVMAGWGALFLALTENRSEWITPVVLTAFVSAVAAWTPHKKKIIAASEVAALIYMIVAMMD